MLNNTIGHDNLASGYQALFSNTTGVDNLAAGSFALQHNLSGAFNLALGVNALLNSTAGASVAIGTNALRSATTGAGNIAIGINAGSNLTTGSNNIEIANRGVAAEAGRIRIGTPGVQTSAFLAGVSGVTIPGPTKTVVVNASGQLGTAPAGTAPAVQTGSTPGASTAQVRHQQREIDRLAVQNTRLQREIAQLQALLGRKH